MGVIRTFDAEIVHNALVGILKKDPNFSVKSWVSDVANIALVNDDGDVALFECEGPGYYSGHYSFNNRGRKAIEAGHAFLDEVLNTCYNVEVIRGLTPLENLGARWMSRKLGFTSYGPVKTDLGPHEIFILTRKEFNQ